MTSDTGVSGTHKVPTGVWPPLMRRTEASRYLATVHGIQRAPATLAKLASVGGGPRFRRLIGSRLPLYEPDELDRWAAQKLGPLRTSTSDEK